MGSLYIAIILCCRVAQHIFSKRVSNSVSNLPIFFKYSAFTNLFSAFLGLILILIVGNGFNCNAQTVAISLFSGAMLLLSTGFGLMALQSGTVALSTMFGTAGLLVPCFAGIFMFDKPMSVGQWLGVGLFFISAYFLISSSSKIYSKFSIKNLLILIGVMLSNGFTMLAQQMFTFYIPDGDVSVFSFLSFGFVGVLMLIISLVFIKKDSNVKTPVLSGNLITMGLILSAAVFVINQLATLSTNIVPPVILFTFINGGSTIIGAVVAAVFFREKLTPRSITGIILGVVSMIIIKAL